jgi:hypothetical protein
MPGLFEADEACPDFNFHDQFNPERYQALSVKILAAYLARISHHPSTRQLLHALLYPEASDRDAASHRNAGSERRIATERRPQHPCSRAATLCHTLPDFHSVRALNIM